MGRCARSPPRTDLSRRTRRCCDARRAALFAVTVKEVRRIVDIREVESITPELALVDPELADIWRRAIPDPPDCLARLPLRTAPAAVCRVPPVKAGGRHTPSMAMVVGTLLLLALTGLPTLDILPHRAVKESRFSTASSSPVLGAAVSAAARQELRWPRITGVIYYDLLVLANGRPVGALRTTSTAVMAASVHAASGRPLRAGAYTWLVIGSRGDGGGWTNLLAHGSFRIPA